MAEKDKPVVAPPQILNMITRLDTLRTLFNENPWLEQEDDWLKRLLLDGHVLCRCCGRHNSKVGSLLANTAKVKRHMESTVHAAKAAAYDARARRLSDLPSGPKARPAAQAVREVRHMLEAAVIGRLVSGGNGAAGIPPSSVDKVFSKELLEAIKCMSNGFPQETAILDRVLPDAVRHVKDRIKTKLSDLRGRGRGASCMSGAHSTLVPRLVLFRRVLTHSLKGEREREGREKGEGREKKKDQFKCQPRLLVQPSVPGRGAQIIVFLSVHLHISF